MFYNIHNLILKKINKKDKKINSQYLQSPCDPSYQVILEATTYHI